MTIKKIAIRTIFCFIFIASFFSLFCIANAKEPKRQNFGHVTGSQEADMVQEVQNLPIDKAIKRLQDEDFRNRKEVLYSAIFNAFKQRKKKAIAYAVDLLRLPLIEEIDGRPVRRRYEDFHIAKIIFEVFPEDSVDELLDLYETGDGTTKGNIIFAVGKVESDFAIRDLLIDALDDKTFYEDPELSLEGIPLRICDLAYNQLVLRYKIKGVLRAIGEALRIEDRNYHINILRKKLENLS
jgi:hypothetical protein